MNSPSKDGYNVGQSLFSRHPVLSKLGIALNLPIISWILQMILEVVFENKAFVCIVD